MIIDVVKIMLPATASFFIGMILSPLLAHYLYQYKAWKKKAGKIGSDGNAAVIFNKLHEHKEVGTPMLGGMVIWGGAAATIIGIWAISLIYPTDLMQKLDFLSRSQTWLPLFTLLVGALVGFIDDITSMQGKGSHASGGLSLRQRLTVVAIIAGFVAWWFFFKLEINTIGIPFWGDFYVGAFFIPLFVFIALAVYAGGVIDGIDGLSGGVFATIFFAYAGIAFYQQQIDLAAFCAAIVGAILAFLWFNIPPAKFYMSETGSMALTMTLTVVAFMTDSLGAGYGVFVLPIIAFPLVITVVSNVIQILSKKIRKGKKVFLVAPLHHHFEAIGWPSYTVTMRYWIVSIIFALIGVIVALIG